MSENKSELIAFRAENRLAKALREQASTEAMSLSDYIRTILRLYLFDYATNSNGQTANGEES